MLSFLITEGQNLIDTSKTWNIYSCNGAFFNSCVTITYKFRSDTVIATKKYYKLFSTYDSLPTNWALAGLLREDTTIKKVYWRLSNVDELLYDFNLNVGDTAKVVASFGNTFCPSTMIVDSIKFNNYYGDIRKQLYFNTPFFYGKRETWIAGIGNLFGLIENKTFVCTADYGPRLICFKQGAALKYSDSNFTTCYKTSIGIKESKSVLNNIIVFPNPSQGDISVNTESNSNKNITIKNELGQIIYQTISSDKNLRINLKQTGMFFITITQDNATWTGKIIKLDF